MERTVHSDLDEARKALLPNVIETYLKLNEAEEEEFRRIIRQEEMGEVRQLLTVYEERGIMKGIVQGKRDSLMRLLRLKFGNLPENVVSKIQAIEDEAELNALVERVLTADSLKEMGLEER